MKKENNAFERYRIKATGPGAPGSCGQCIPRTAHPLNFGPGLRGSHAGPLKKSIFLLISLLVFTLLQGCNSGSNDTAGDLAPSSSQSSQNIAQWGGPERPADLWSQVKTIRGNKLTVYKVENNTPQTEEERNAQRGQIQSLSSEERAKAQAERIKVSDETVDIIIPVGTPVLATGNLGAEAAEVDISQIKQGDIVKFWLEGEPSGDGESTAEFVQINQGGYGQ